MADMDLEQFRSNVVVEWADKYVHFRELLAIIANVSDDRPDHDRRDAYMFRTDRSAYHAASSGGGRGGGGDGSDGGAEPRVANSAVADQLDRFDRLLRDDATTVTSFYTEQERLLVERMEDLEVYRETPGHNGKTLKKALVELYRAVLLLQNYATLNYTAATQAEEAMDAATETWRSPWTVQRRHSRQIQRGVSQGRLGGSSTGASGATAASGHLGYYQRSQNLEVVLMRIQQAFANMFTAGDVVEARKQLTERLHTPPRRYGDVFMLGFFGGFSIPLVIVLLVLVSTKAVDAFDPMFLYATLPVWRATGVIILVFWLWGVCVAVFERWRVNYSFILDLKASTMIDFHNLFKTATLLTALWLASFACFIASLRRDIDILPINRRWYPFTLVVTLVVIFLCPLNIVHRSSRWWLMKRLFQVVVSPFGAVTFASSLVGDYLTSLVKVLYDIEFVGCFYLTGDWWDSDYDRCQQQNKDIALPLLVGLPFFWRLMQNLRRSYETGDKWPHLGNAGKYAVALTAAILGAFHTDWTKASNTDWDEARVAYICFLVFASLYAYVWDITMDWSLVWWSRGRIRVRTKFIYGSKYLYIVPAIANVVGRAVWALTLYIQPASHENRILNPQLLTFVLTAAEVVRRSVWAVIRLENEHSNNCGRFRAVKDIPLRFHAGVRVATSGLDQVEDFVEAVRGVDNHGGTGGTRDVGERQALLSTTLV